MTHDSSVSLAQARRQASTLASSHYENFAVAGLVRDRRKREELHALYTFARGLDDLADETQSDHSPLPRRELLDEWQQHLEELYRGCQPFHPVFVALEPVIQAHRIEKELFLRMVEAFRLDVPGLRFSTWEQVQKYTVGSADPVGRWVLRLHGIRDRISDEASDLICTALQLVNFLQDIREDFLKRDRIYLPLEDMDRFKVKEGDLAQASASSDLKALLQFETERAKRLFEAGKPLISRVPSDLKLLLRMFYLGGLAALRAVERNGGRDLIHRPTVTAGMKVSILIRALAGAV